MADRSHMFDMRTCLEDMTAKSGGAWVALPTSSSASNRRLAKTDYPELYDELSSRYDANTTTSISYKIRDGILFNTETPIDTSEFYDTGSPIKLINGQVLTASSDVFPNVAQGNNWGVSTVVNSNGNEWNNSTYYGIMSARELWHYKGEQYVDPSGNVKQYLADTLYAAEEYENSILPRFLCPSIEINRSYIRVYAAYENSTAFDMYNGIVVSHGLDLNTCPNDDWIVSFGVDSSGFFCWVQSAHRDYSSGRKNIGVAKPQLMGEKVLGNSVAGGDYNRAIPKIYVRNTITLTDNTTYFNGLTDLAFTTEKHFMTPSKSTYGQIVYTANDNIAAQSRIFKLTPNYVILPLAPRKYSYDTGLETVYNIRVKP